MAIKDFKKGTAQITFRSGTDEVLKAFDIKSALTRSLTNLGMTWPADLSKGNEPTQH